MYSKGKGWRNMEQNHAFFNQKKKNVTVMITRVENVNLKNR